MKKKMLKSKLSLKVKDLSVLNGKETKDVKGGAFPTIGCPPDCITMSCPDGGYSCQFHCLSEPIR